MEDPWKAPDGTRWLHFRQYGEWHGWVPGEDGVFVMNEDEFALAYPEARGLAAEDAGT